MKIVRFLSLLFILLSLSQAADNSLSLQFTTASYYGRYAPRHCIAVWVTTESGDFVKTLQVNGRVPYYRIMLAQWVIDSDWDSTDAVTSASINQHRSHTVAWDLTDVQGNQVEKGAYKLWIEVTEDNSQVPGRVPLAELDFEISDKSFDLDFDNVSHNNRVSIKDIKVALAMSGSPIKEQLTASQKVQHLTISNNTISLKDVSIGEYAVTIRNARGQLLLDGKTQNGAFSIESLPKGVYIATMENGSKSYSESFTK